MNREQADIESQDEDFEDTEALSTGAETSTDNVGDVSVELNVDDLMSEVEAAGLPTDHFKHNSARRRLDDMLEERRMSREMSDFDEYEVD